MELIDGARASLLEGKMVSPVASCGGSREPNTVVGLSNLGGNCGFIGKVKNDTAGEQFKSKHERTEYNI